MARKCGSEIAWAKTWQAAAARAKRERRLVLVFCDLYSAFNVGDTANHGAFMDPDVVELVGERFVAWRLVKTSPAPFPKNIEKP